MRKVIKVKKFGLTSLGQQIYSVMLDDGTEATTLEKFVVGNRALAWFDHKYNKIKLVRPKR